MTQTRILTTEPCMYCGKTSEVIVPVTVYQALLSGAMIQNAWPEATPATRELLISGSHDECFQAMFPPEED